MKFEAFKSGEYRQQYQYKSFLPEKINHEWTWNDPRISVMLEKATKALGKLIRKVKYKNFYFIFKGLN